MVDVHVHVPINQPPNQAIVITQYRITHRDRITSSHRSSIPVLFLLFLHPYPSPGNSFCLVHSYTREGIPRLSTT